MTPAAVAPTVRLADLSSDHPSSWEFRGAASMGRADWLDDVISVLASAERRRSIAAADLGSCDEPAVVNDLSGWRRARLGSSGIGHLEAGTDCHSLGDIRYHRQRGST